MSTPAVQAALLRDLMRQVGADTPDQLPLALRVGETFGGRVSLGPTGERQLMVAGVLMKAQLPADIPIGQALRFQVTETGADKLVLQVVRDVAAGPEQGVSGPRDVAQQSQTVTVPQGGVTTVPMPTGAQARVWADPDGSNEGEGETSSRRAQRISSGTMVVRYDSPALGRVDIVLRLDPDKLEAHVLAPAGEPLAHVRSASAALREALLVATERPVSLQTGGRTEDAVNVRV